MFKRKQSQERKQQPAGLEIPLRLGPAVRGEQDVLLAKHGFSPLRLFQRKLFFTEKTEQSQKNKKDVDLEPLYLNLEPNTSAEAGVFLSQISPTGTVRILRGKKRVMAAIPFFLQMKSPKIINFGA